MFELMNSGWKFNFFANDLGSFTAIATKEGTEVVTDIMPTGTYFMLVDAICRKVEDEAACLEYAKNL